MIMGRKGLSLKWLAPVTLFFTLLVLTSGVSFSADTSITLQWQPSLSNGVIGYNVYRSTTSGSGYQQLNSEPVADTTYTDLTASPGTTYYYVCRAVTVDGTESDNSNEVEYFLEDPNSPPEAVDDNAQVSEESWVDITPLENDYDADGDPLELISITQPSHGTAAFSGLEGIRYTPEPDYFGQDSFTYTISDPGGKEDTGSVFIEVDGINDAPQATSLSYTTNEDSPVEIDLQVGASDPDEDTLTYDITAVPANGMIEPVSGGVYLYTPGADFSGTDSFTYEVADASTSDTAEVSITVVEINDPPLAADDSFTSTEGMETVFNVLANDSDPEGQQLAVSILSQPSSGGTVQVREDGTVVYSPQPYFNGTDSFTYAVTDSGGASANAQVSLNVTPVASVFQAVSDSMSIVEDSSGILNLLANDENPDSLPLNLLVQSPPVHGQVQLEEDGQVTYTPAADYNGADSFTYILSDEEGNSSTASVSINVTQVNDPPLAASDTAVLNEDERVTFQLLVNDTDVDNDILSASLSSPPQNGQATVTSDGTAEYVPEPDFSGSDTFSYRVSDGTAAAYAEARITVNPVNDPPTASSDSSTTQEGQEVTIQLMANDSDPDNDPLTISLASPPDHGEALIGADGTASYTPSEGFSGLDAFTYELSDGEASSTASVRITVSAVNDPPVAVDDYATTDEDQPVSIPVLANDSDSDNDTLTARLLSAPSHGSVTISPEGSAGYTPEANYNGNDSFEYEVSDGTSSSSAEVTITIHPVNDPPEAVDDSLNIKVGRQGEIDLLANDNDPDGDALTATLVEGPEHGTATVGVEGIALYSPAADFSGSDSFVYKALDPSGESSMARVNIEVSASNSPPVAVSDEVSVRKKTAVTIDVISNDYDPDGDQLELVEISRPANGTALIKSLDGEIEYQPQTWFRGTDTFAYVITDRTEEATGLVTVSVINKPSVLKFSFPRSIDDGSSRFEDTYIGVGIVNPNKSEEDVAFIGFDETGNTREVINLGEKLPPQGQVALMTSELGKTDESVARLTAEGQSEEVQGFFMVGDVDTKRLDGVGGVQIPSRFFYFPVAIEDDNTSTLIYLVSQDSEDQADVNARLIGTDGEALSSKAFQIAPNGSVSGNLSEIFGNGEEKVEISDGYIEINSTSHLTGYEIIVRDESVHAFSARNPEASAKLFAPHFIAGADNNSFVRILCEAEEELSGVLTLMNDQGQTIVSSRITLDPKAVNQFDLNSLLAGKYETLPSLVSGSLLVEFGTEIPAAGTITMDTSEGKAVTAMPLEDEGLVDFVFPQVAQSDNGTIFTGFAIMNPGDTAATAVISAYNSSGILAAEKQLAIPPLHRITDLLNGDMFFGREFSQMGGHIKIVSDKPLISVSIYGDYRGRYLSTIEGQLGEIEAQAAASELERSLAEEN